MFAVPCMKPRPGIWDILVGLNPLGRIAALSGEREVQSIRTLMLVLLVVNYKLTITVHITILIS